MKKHILPALGLMLMLSAPFIAVDKMQGTDRADDAKIERYQSDLKAYQ